MAAGRGRGAGDAGLRALNLVGPRQASLVVVPEPLPGRGDVLIRVRACGVCGSDLNAWRGVPGIEYPLTPGAPGHETWGEVVAVGDGVSGFSIGEPVTGLVWNGFAEVGVGRAVDLVGVPAWMAQRPVPGEPLACAMNVVRRAAVGRGERVAFVGFGYLAALVAMLLPAHVGGWLAVSRRADSRALALRLGAEAAYDFGEIPARLWDSLPVVVEAAGAQPALDHATWLVAYGGRLVIAGYHADGPRTVNMQSWNWKGIDVVNAHARQPGVLVDALQAAFEVLRDRSVDVAGLHSHVLPLARAVDAFGLAEARPPGFFKALVCP